LLQHLDDLGVLVGFNAVAVISQGIRYLPIFEVMEEGRQLGDQLSPESFVRLLYV
jgi:hypothetical protein